MDTSQQWARLLTAAREVRTGADRAAALDLAMALGSEVTERSVGCSITERSGDIHRTVAAANAMSLALDLAQYAAGSGPCVATADERVEHRVDEMPGEDRFAAFGATAVEHGVYSSLSLPLAGPAALNLYAAEPAAFQPDRVHAVAALLARCVSPLLRTGAAAETPDVPAQRVRAAAQAGARTDRAVRTVMAAEGLTRGDAFGRLARRSQAEHRSLHDVVTDVLGGEAR